MRWSGSPGTVPTGWRREGGLCAEYDLAGISAFVVGRQRADEQRCAALSFCSVLELVEGYLLHRYSVNETKAPHIAHHTTYSVTRYKESYGPSGTPKFMSCERGTLGTRVIAETRSRTREPALRKMQRAALDVHGHASDRCVPEPTVAASRTRQSDDLFQWTGFLA